MYCVCLFHYILRLHAYIQGHSNLNWYFRRGSEFCVATKPCAIVCRTKNKCIRFICIISVQLRLNII